MRCLFLLSFLLSAVLFLAGCASKPLTPIDNLERYQRQLEAVDQWQVKGRINVKVPGDSDTVSVTWENSKSAYDIRLRGTLGIGTTKIHGTANEVRMEQNGKEPVIAATAEDLLYRELGREIPISDLHYWVRGLQAPNPTPSNIDVAEQGTLSRLEQAGWTITYSEYTAVGEWNMPKKIVAKRDDFVLTLYGLRWAIHSAL